MRINQKKQAGAAMVEFALVLPILLFVVFGIAELGIGLYDKAVITNASREGARAGIVLRNPKPGVTDITRAATLYAQNYLITFGRQNVPVVTVTGNLGGGFGTEITVNVAYQYTGLGLGKLLSVFNNGPVTIAANTTMNNE